jgi:hypothetical protein
VAKRIMEVIDVMRLERKMCFDAAQGVPKRPEDGIGSLAVIDSVVGRHGMLQSHGAG